MAKHKHKSVRSLILQRLGMMTYIKPVGYWLDTGDKDFNAVLGSKSKGVPSGRIFELAGKNHGGKTLICNYLAGLAQKQFNAFVLEIQLENSHDDEWSMRLGVQLGSKQYYLCVPKILTLQKKSKSGKIKKGKSFLQSAEYLFQEAEEVMLWVKEKHPERPIFVFIDSVANLQTQMQVEKGTVDQNMRSNMDRAQFLSRTLPRWSALAQNYDAWIFLVNQIRTKPGVMFGSPEYTPGGNSLEHDTHVRVWVRKIKGGQLLKNGKQIGLKGKLVNYKNKAGGGSEPYKEVGFKVDWTKPTKKMFHFMSVKEVKGDD